MNPAVSQMLRRYTCSNRGEYERAIKEILQELALVGLWRSKFFEHAAFYGGTALRILHGLDRFSEDLDFTLLQPDPEFTLDSYNQAIKSELEAFGFTVEVDSKDKSWNTPVRSAFIRTRALGEFLKIGVPRDLIKGYHPDTLLKIKIEIDTDPADAYRFDTHFLLRPFSVGIRAVLLEDMFAGKMHAVLFRQWQGRVKGRDWYDWLWLIRQGVVLNLERLSVHMRKAGNLEADVSLSRPDFEKLVLDRIAQVDIGSARDDMRAYATHRGQFEDWSADLFRHFLSLTKTC